MVKGAELVWGAVALGVSAFSLSCRRGAGALARRLVVVAAMLAAWGCAGETPIYCEAKGCNDGNPCTEDRCEPSSGCKHTALDAGTCSDGNPCTAVDLCKAGTCTAGGALACEDGNPCTGDSCDPLKGCVFSPVEGPCSDGNPCTLGDACAKGSCGFQTLLACQDDNSCTQDSCDAASGCTHLPLDATCSDGNACTAGDSCEKGSCAAGTAVSCDDGNPCTADGCSGDVGCTHQVALGSACDDANACTLSDACTATAHCQGGQQANCDDGSACTGDACDLATGCTHTDLTVACTDGDACTLGDLCGGGKCNAGAPLGCNDSNPCSDDSCEAVTGCQHSANGAPCDDGNLCTKGDSCSSFGCKSGLSALCNDKNACTSDSCDPATGDCMHAELPGLACDDGNNCTSGDVCGSGGACAGAGKNCSDGDACTKDTCNAGVCSNTAFAPDICDDGKPCTTDTCDWKVGCAHQIEAGLACDDGNKCTDSDKCSAGAVCQGLAKTCNDGNPCTADSCNAKQGCVFTSEFVVGLCSDGNPCTANDVCSGGKCLGTGQVNCDDANECTGDFCDPAVGCKHSAMPAWTPCKNDSEYICTGSSTCGLSVLAKAAVVIPKGRSAFGCAAKDYFCSADESPAHVSEISSFYMHLFEVSAKQYQACIQAGACTGVQSLATQCALKLGKLDHPMDCVNADQAAKYCAWQGMRLPTEHEWERAGRGDCGSLSDSACLAAAKFYPWGNDIPTCDYAVFNSGGPGCGSGGTWTIGAGQNSEWGIASLAGNVAEWVADGYSATAYSNVEAKDPKGPAGGNQVLRGGSYLSDFKALRSSARQNALGSDSKAGLGFRCARSVGTKP